MVDLEYYEPMIDLKPYEPRAIKHESDDDGFSVLIHDDKGNYPDVWIDVWVTDYNDLEFDWNMWIFHKDNPYEQSVRAFMDLAIMNDGWLYCLCTECAEQYLIANNFIRQIKNGDWERC